VLQPGYTLSGDTAVREHCLIKLAIQRMDTITDLHDALQKAVQLEFATLPPYLYAMFSLRKGTNAAAHDRFSSIVREEMIHMTLACNIINAIGGRPMIADTSTVPTYPGPLPFDIGDEHGEKFVIELLPFGSAAVQQAMHIEEPEDPLIFELAAVTPSFQTIGQFYQALDAALSRLDQSAWADPQRNQLTDHPFFAGQLFPVTDYTSASKAISNIVSEGEGNKKSPVNFEGELAHYYRFEEIYRDQVLQKDTSRVEGFSWGASLGIDWDAVHPAIPNPGEHDFAGDPEAQAAQDACDRAFTVMVQELDHAVNGAPARLGNAVRAMFDLRMAAVAALATPLKGSTRVAGPAFAYRPELVSRQGG
jgi:hypothetical protein